jgi:hypothetical protein
MLQERDYLQIHLYPIHPLPFLDTSDEKIQLGVLINGTNVGNFNADDIVSCLERMDKSKHRSLFVIHSLLGHNMDQTIAILKAAGIKKDGGNISGFLWLHDYSPLYNNYKLLRNDVEYRGIPREGTVAWELCEFARAEFSHRAEFAKLLQAFDVELLSPSQAAQKSRGGACHASAGRQQTTLYPSFDWPAEGGLFGLSQRAQGLACVPTAGARSQRRCAL